VTAPPAAFELARKVADAVLYEGYLLYPYRASAAKNQARWQFGVLMPRLWSEAGPEEPWSTQTECLLEPDESTTLHVLVRFLHVQAKTVEAVDIGAGTFQEVASLQVDGSELLPWDEATEQDVTVEAPLARLLEAELVVPFERPGGRKVEPVHTPAGKLIGRTVRRRWPVLGAVRLSAERLEGPYGLVRLRVRVENTSVWNDQGAGRDIALRRSLVAAHTLLAVDRGVFLSLLDPPEWAKPAVTACENVHTWPVLVGDEDRHDAVLSSPIILYDHPAIAPESPGDLFDSTEIDEILTLRTMALTDAEKREARATDERAAAIIDRVDTMPAELLERLHGAVRYLRGVEGAQDQGSVEEAGITAQPAPEAVPELVPWWDPGADIAVSPETDGVVVAGVNVAKGSRVRLRPGQRRADAQDMFLVDRLATVEAVFLDVDGARHLAVTLDEDPAADLQRWHGRFLYFSPDEVEPL
jgi:hypothetical protein